MTWEELKEEAKKMGGKVVEIDYKDYIDGYAYTSHLVEAIKFRDIYYVIDGDILMKFENIKKFCKIKHIPYCEGYEKMLAIMKALQ